MSSSEFPIFVKKLIDSIALENNFRDYSVDVKSGSEAGDGFTSQISCIAITERNGDKRLDLVAKVGPANANFCKEFFVDQIFGREAFVYDRLLPTFAKFQEEKNVPKAEQFVSYPKCYATLIDPENAHFVIILEDLRQKDFKMWSKLKPSPIENVRIAMRELRKFHGLSIAMEDQNPDEFAEFKQLKELMKACLKSENAQNMFKSSFDRATNALKSDEHKAIMQHIKNNFMDYMHDCLNDEAAKQFGVLCHGDFWNNNMLFKFNKNKAAEEVRFVDWQVARYLSPATDVVYILFTSTDKAFRDIEFEKMLQIYHDSMSNMVKLLGSDPNRLFTFQRLKDELKKFGNYALIMSPMLSEVSQADSSKITNLDEAFDKIADGNGTGTLNLITGLSDEGQLEYERRLGNTFADVIRLGYYHRVN